MHSRALASLYLSIQRVIRGLTGIKHTYIRPDPLFPAYAYRHPFSIGLSLKKKKKNSEEWSDPEEKEVMERRGEREKKKQIPRKEFFVSSSPPYTLFPSFFFAARAARCGLSPTFYLISSFLRTFLPRRSFPPPPSATLAPRAL